MNLKTLIFYFRLAFYFLGLAAKNPFLTAKQSFRGFIDVLPSLIVFCLALISSVITVLIHHIYNISFVWSDMVGDILVYISSVAVILTPMVVSATRHPDILQLESIFHSIETFLHQEFHLTLNFRLFLKRYLHKIYITLLFYLFTIFGKVLLVREQPGVTIELLYCFIRLFAIVSRLYVLFYVSLLKSFVRLFRRFNPGQCFRPNAFSKIDGKNSKLMLQQYKIIHLKFFVAATYINGVFGWCFVSIIILTIFDGSYAIYRVFYYFQKEQAEQTYVIRK